MNKRPWWNELELNVQGRAHPMLDNTILSLKIIYGDKQAKWYAIPLKRGKHKGSIQFKKKIESINNATEMALAGKYLIKIEFIPVNQSVEVYNLLKKRLKNKKIKGIQRSVFIGTKSQQLTQVTNIKNFYTKKIQEINNLFGDIFKKRKLALLMGRYSGKNPFIDNGKFSYQKWVQWYKNLDKKLNKQQLSLNTHSKKLMALLYPQTNNNLKVYCDLVRNTATIYANAMYKYHRQKDKNSRVKYRDPYTFTSLRRLLKHINTLHKQMEEELAINLRKQLGYFPPPPIFTY